MMAKSHVVIGAAAWIVTAPLLHFAPWDAVNIALAIGGSLLPDIDHPQSWVGRRTRPVSTILAGTLGHRGVTHSAFAIVALSLLLVHAGYRHSLVAALAVGYLSHLAADMLTSRGLRLAWPHPRTWGLPLCRTGSPMEGIIVMALVIGVGWWVVSHGTWPPLRRLGR
jgi:inner membrane protein